MGTCVRCQKPKVIPQIETSERVTFDSDVSVSSRVHEKEGTRRKKVKAFASGGPFIQYVPVSVGMRARLTPFIYFL